MKMSPDCSKTNAKGRVPRTQKGRLRVDLLKQTARGLFVDLGYDATTMSAIAAEAGASIGSLYQYFPTKQHIVQEIEKDGLSAVLACLDGLGACDRPPSEIAVEAFDALVDYGNKDPAFRVISERHDLDPAARKQMRDMICARIADRLRRAEPPLSPSRAMVSAILVLHLADAAHAPGLAANPASDSLMRTEIRRMLRLYLQDPALV